MHCIYLSITPDKKETKSWILGWCSYVTVIVNLHILMQDFRKKLESAVGKLKEPIFDGQFTGFFVGSTTSASMMVSYLLFADDTLIFCDVDPNRLVTLREILNRFEEASGLKIDLGKSELVPVGEVHNLDILVGLLGCRQSSLPLKYLGLSLGAKFKEVSL